ncbi:MAG: KamA family radical SAM protein [Verrucomicrobiae bacterium]|nr:KamA family radical SAM protein [Verrucomicrobiae bacterium]MDW7980450.1 KamA family radical SAM protein [Verrucomicrobiales bacterium]
MSTKTESVEPRLRPRSERLDVLKQFFSHARRLWHDVAEGDWNDWRWQLKHRITTVEQLEKFLPTLTPEERAGALVAEARLALAVTPYFFTLIDPTDPDCPIRRQVIPRAEETHVAPYEMPDPCGEELHSPVPGLVHRYPDRVLLLVTDRCATYCRYCTRARLVSHGAQYDFHTRLEQQLDYIRNTKAVRDVLISGGDPLLLSEQRLAELLGRLRAIPHVELVRIGTRVPIFLPQRITDELCATLRRYHPLFISIHSNHPRELTIEARNALWRLADAGIPLGNQSVLLRGVNDDPVVLMAHMQKLLICRVKPYYLYQCDLVPGTSHFRVSVRKGIELMDALRGHTSGYAVPTYVIDAPGGGGKVPVGQDYVLSHDDYRLVLRNYEGKLFEYPESGAAEHTVTSSPELPTLCGTI